MSLIYMFYRTLSFHEKECTGNDSERDIKGQHSEKELITNTGMQILNNNEKP